MRIRNRQVRLPLSLLSPVPISDLKTTFTVPAAALEQQQEVVQLHQQPPSSSTQQAAAEHVDQNYPQLVAPAAPLVSTAHDQSDQPTYQHHDEETTHGDPSDLRQKEGGRMITVEDQKVFDGEPVDHQVDNHDHDHGRKLRQEILNKSHVRTKCCTNSTSSKQQGRSDAAAKSSESSGILAADNKLFLINPHCSSTPQGARTLAGQQMPAVGCDGYPWCCQEEKSIPLKKRRGSCCPTIAPPCIAESDYHDNHQKVEDSGDNKKQQKNSMAILCKTNQKGIATAGACKTRDKKIGGGPSTSSVGGAYNNIMELGGGSRCSRVNGRSWRCNQPTLVGYSLCQHHLGQGRKRTSKQPFKKKNIKTVKKQQLSESSAPAAISIPSSSTNSNSDMKRVKSIVKSRSLSSLLSQIDNAIAVNPAHNNVREDYDLNA